MLRIATSLVFITLAVCRATSAVAYEIEAGSQSTIAASADAPVDQLIPWLLNEDNQLRGIPFAEVILNTTGKHVLAVNVSSEIDQRIIKKIAAACDETMKRMNAPDSAIQNVSRINELSAHFEDMLRELLTSTRGLSCDFPRTAEGRVQRSGYPDLRIVDLESKRVFYLDPKLYAEGSRDSTFRAFYFEPKETTNKVHDDAVHFIVGFEHPFWVNRSIFSMPFTSKRSESCREVRWA